MGVKNIRLASMLAFDEQQEADIIRLIESFNSSHKMGEFLSNLIRIAVENPELVVAKNGNYETGALVKVMEKLGKSPTRSDYMQSVNKQLINMQTKVDQIYDMCLKMYTMAEMGKMLGFEKKTENMIIAEFMIEQQLTQLKNITGADCRDVVLASNRIEYCEKRAAETLEYILSCYEPIIAELKNELTIKPIEIQQVQQTEIPQTTNRFVQPAPISNGSNTESRQLNIQPVELIKDESELEDEIVDFSQADFSALENFLGN